MFNTVYQLNGNLDQGDSIRPQDFAFNYTSKTGSDHYGSTPLGAAKYMNDLIYNDGLFTPGSKTAKENPRLGIVVMDFVNKQLCRRIIDRNAFPSSAAMKVGTVTADGETQTAEQTPFLSAFAEMPLSDGLTATTAPAENVSAPPVPAEDAPAPTENVTVPPAPTEGASAPAENVTAPPAPTESTPTPTEGVTVPPAPTEGASAPPSSEGNTPVPAEGVTIPPSSEENVNVPPSPTVSEEIVWPVAAELTYG